MKSSFENFKALKASAGSGKTFALTVRYLSLVFSGVHPSKILALTFTKKAANEMSERIVNTFINLEKDDKKAQVIEICKTLNLSKDELFKKRDEVYTNFMNAEIKISTFDAFFATILRSFATYFGLDANFDIKEDMSEVINKEFIKNIAKNPTFLDEISSFIVETGSNTSKFLKTLDEISTQMGELNYPKGVKFPSDTTFLKAQENIINFLDTAIKNDDEKVSKQATMLKEKLSNSMFKILGESFIARESLDYRTYLALYKYDNSIDTFFANLKAEICRYLQELEAYKLSKFSEILELFIKTKREVNKSLNTITFNDLSTIIFELLSKDEMMNMIYFRLDARIEHILIDEFQDTSVMQYKILFPLISEIVSGYGQTGLGSFFYVGDIKQSIYRFRGAKKEIFTNLGSVFSQIKTHSLEYNYRSTKAIVKFVNSVFRGEIHDYEDQISNFKFQNEPIFNPTVSPNFNLFEIEDDDFGYLKSLTVDDLEEKDLVLNTAVNEVIKLIKSGANSNDIAILCFKNENIDALKDKLLKEGIVSSGEGKRTLLDLPKTRAVIEYAKFCSTAEEIYALNVERLIGKKPPLLKLEKSTNENILYIIERLGLGLDDKNILLLIDEANKYKNIYEFAFNGGETLAINDENIGVSLLTIHKSKGLEFGHVVICDSFQKGSYDSSNFIKEYNVENKIWNIKYRVKGREFVDESYKSLVDEIKKLDKEESINKLYVAFTRAVKSLILVKSSQSYSSFRNEKTTKSGNFLLDIPDFEFGSIIADEFIRVLDKPLKTINLAAINPQKIAKKEDIVLNLDSINFGLAMHYSLEMCTKFDNLENAILKAKDKFSKFLKPDKFNDIQNRISMLFSNESFLNLTNNAKIQKEQPFKIGSEIKQIDLLAIKDDEINIIDYKSTVGFEAKNKEQVLGYKEALQGFYKDKKVSAYIFYLLENKILIEKV